MGIFARIKDSWQTKSTVEKVNFVLDLICSIGTGAIGITAGRKLSQDCKPVTKVCVRVSCAGLAMAAGDIATKELQEHYGKPVAAIIDHVKANKKKEEDKTNADG